MKDTDFESKLRDTPLQPRRSLHRDFTKQAMMRIAADQKKSRIHNATIALQRIFTMKTLSFTRPVITAAAILGITVAGGTAYAIVKGWPQAQSFFAGESSLQNGNKLYAVTSKDCITTRTEDVAKKTDWVNIQPSNRLTKFEVEAGTKVDTKDLEQVALAMCNEGAANKQSVSLLEKDIAPGIEPLQKKQHYNNQRLIITAIDEMTVTGQMESYVYDDATKSMKPVAYSRTYTFDAGVKAFDYDAAIPLSQLKAGDSVDVMLYSESMPEYMLGVSPVSSDGTSLNGLQMNVKAVGLIKLPQFVRYEKAYQALVEKYQDKIKVESITVE